MKKLIIIFIIIIIISCNNEDRFFPSYEGIYVLNRNDSGMDNLYFYNIDTFEEESNSIFGYFKGLDTKKNKKFSTTIFSTNILGKKFIECDIDHIYDYKKVD